MANRSALRELQQRLADRLQTAKEQEHAVSWLAVVCGGIRYLFPLTQAEEIFSSPRVQPVPYAQSWFLGVANLRGSLYGVVHLAHFIGTSSNSTTHASQAPSEASLVTINAALEINCALWVDRLAGLKGVESFKTSHQAPAGAPDFFGHRYVGPDGISWQELNLQTLSRSARFLGIGV